MMTTVFTLRDPFAGYVSQEAESLEEAIEALYEFVPEDERPAYVWYNGQQVSVPRGTCRPV